MSSKWHEKQEKKRLEQLKREEEEAPDEIVVKSQISAASMGKGEDELFQRKMGKDEKKALAKAKRDAKKGNPDETLTSQDPVGKVNLESALLEASSTLVLSKDLSINNAAAEKLAAEGTICTFAVSRKGVDARSRDINIGNFTLQHKGNVLLDATEIILNHGNRYGLIGRNGCGKSTFLKALGTRSVPIPDMIDLYFLKEEVEARKDLTALEAVMSVDEEREKLEKQVENLNTALASLGDKVADGEDEPPMNGENANMSVEEQQETIMELLSTIYERLDALDASTAETRARSILKGLGFTHAMQSKATADFSGGWRMRVSLARALFLQPTLLLLDEPTNHLDMEAVIWLEEYLSNWDKILLLISHSQDFMNTVCTHTIHFTNKGKLEYYDGNYDQFVKTKAEKEDNQMKKYSWEQQQIKDMKDYIARFGHGTAKHARQAQSREKVLEKMIRAGLTEKPDTEKMMNFKFSNPGQLPPPVLAFHDVSFAYPNCETLYTSVNIGVDLDSRVALVGPNGAGKTTLIKLMAGELLPSSGDIKPHGHLKIGRFTQHFIDVLDLNLTPLEFFEQQYPSDPREEHRKYLGRFGISGTMQSQKMEELSDGQKSRVVFAKLGREVPHILLLDEPTNHLDMESIDALANAINEFEGGLILVSHDMRLISQVAKEIWICDNKCVTVYNGDIQNFKMQMRSHMGVGEQQKTKLRGDASVVKKSSSTVSVEGKGASDRTTKTPQPPSSKPKTVDMGGISKGSITKSSSNAAMSSWDDNDEDTQTTSTTMSSFEMDGLKKHLPAAEGASGKSSYVPPHFRNKK